MTPPEDPEAVDRAAASLDRFDWMVFESAVVGRAVLAALARGPRDLRALGRASICAVGPSTADQLAAHGLKADVVIPELRVGEHRGRDGGARADRGPPGSRRPARSRAQRRGRRARRNAARPSPIWSRTARKPTRRTRPRRSASTGCCSTARSTPSRSRARPRFAVSSAIIGEEQAADLLGTTVVAAIGPVTAAAALEIGITPTIVADTFTVDGLVQAFVKHFAN